MITKHPLKIESLDMPVKKADTIAEIMKEFFIGLGYQKEKIEPLECRFRDGFVPYSHNKGGFEAVAFTDQASVDSTGFKNADETLDRYYKYDLENFKADKKYRKMNEKRWDEFYEYRREDDQATIMFSGQFILNSENEATLYLDVCVKDTPYHRQVDDRLTFNLNFKTENSLKNKLKKILKDVNVKQFARCLDDAY